MFSAAMGVALSVAGVTYPTFDPATKSASAVLSNGNLTCQANGGGFTPNGARGTIVVPSASVKYWEVMVDSGTAVDQLRVGLTTQNPVSSLLGTNDICYAANGYIYVAGFPTSFASSYTAGDLIGVVYSTTAGTVDFYKNNVFQVQVTGVSPTSRYPGFSGNVSSHVVTINFGPSTVYSLPSGASLLTV